MDEGLPRFFRVLLKLDTPCDNIDSITRATFWNNFDNLGIDGKGGQIIKTTLGIFRNDQIPCKY
jgi:hypothetical protein